MIKAFCALIIIGHYDISVRLFPEMLLEYGYRGRMVVATKHEFEHIQCYEHNAE